VREGKGTKGSERVIGKAAGDERVFIPGEGPGWQMRSGPTPYQTRQAARWSQEFTGMFLTGSSTHERKSYVLIPKAMQRVTIDGMQTAL
jgi:hypothetical protein